MKQYGLYDLKDYEQCVYVGNIKEISNYLGYSDESLRSYLSRKRKGRQELLKHRYELIEIYEEDEPEEEKKIRKNNREIFKEIIETLSGLIQITTFKEEIAKFEIFNEFK